MNGEKGQQYEGVGERNIEEKEKTSCRWSQL